MLSVPRKKHACRPPTTVLAGASPVGVYNVSLSTLILYPNTDNYNPTTGTVTLTKPTTSYSEAAYYPSYLRISNPAFFQINFTFSFDQASNPGADGFAFVLHNQSFSAI